MASKLSIINMALQQLGQTSVGSESEFNAQEILNCYDLLRDYEQRANAWNFCKSRQILAPHPVAPAFTYGYAFRLPNGCLRILKPSRLDLDWSEELHEGEPAILTNDGTSIPLRFIQRVTNEGIFDPMFSVMFACALAWECCERITQSNSKRDAVKDRYILQRREARRMNAFEVLPIEQPTSSWLQSMQTGGLANAEWSE